MIFDDRTGPLRSLYQNGNVSTATFTLPGAFESEPTADGYYHLGLPDGPAGPKRALLIPYGTAAATKTFSMYVYLLRKTMPKKTGNQQPSLWIPMMLASFDCTLCTKTGVGSNYIPSTQFFCDTIAASMGSPGVAGVDYNIRSPTGNGIASVDVALYGNAYLSAIFAIGTSQATDANTLVAPL